MRRTDDDKRARLQEPATNHVTRRRFARTALATGSWAAVASVWGGTAPASAQTVTDVDILNFALNLEYLEAEFYTVATSGRRLAEVGVEVTGRGRTGETVGGGKVALDETAQVIAEQIALDERGHVQFLRAALGRDAVAKPAIDLEALGLGFRNEREFLTLARAFEDLGMSAYGGAAALIDDSRILTAAARIALTEAQHVGAIRLIVAQRSVVVPQVDDMDVPPLGSPRGRLFQVDGAGLSTVRTPAQVLAVAGPFFPNGVNGTIGA